MGMATTAALGAKPPTYEPNMGMGAVPATLGAKSPAAGPPRIVQALAADCTYRQPPAPQDWTNFTSDGTFCTAVVSVFNDKGGRYLSVVRDALPRSCRLVAYDKTPDVACDYMPLPGVAECHVLPNTGLEDQVWAYHVNRTYADAPRWLLGIPGAVNKHNRVQSLHDMLAATLLGNGDGLTGEGFWCPNRALACGMPPGKFHDEEPTSLANYSGCRAAWKYNGKYARPSKVYPLGNYIHEMIGLLSPGTDDHLCYLPACHFSMFATTRENIHAHPQAVYDRLATSLADSPGGYDEKDFYDEWMAAATYGALAARKLPACPASEGYSSDFCAMGMSQGYLDYANESVGVLTPD